MPRASRSKEKGVQRRPPTPVCKCFLLCRRIYADTARQDYVLASPVHQIFPGAYPCVEGLSVFARWTNAHGSYPVELLVRTLEGEVFWRQRMAQPVSGSGPVAGLADRVDGPGHPVPGPRQVRGGAAG